VVRIVTARFTMQLKPGLRLQSITCDTQVIVVRGNGDVDIRCGGVPMAPADASADRQPLDGTHATGTLMGKRYADADLGVELLCTKPGEGSLSIGDAPLLTKDAKPLPSSD
jgi:hypothetical protein